ncbi:gibberellin 3-beta-dioxygenase 1-like [Typha latifolia]|uniref:gibberellin 3-beta-dioxygenase 1-like n=1 Tax=Typha latifolia TaxID=4733 RepID=UPI003C2C031F
MPSISEEPLPPFSPTTLHQPHNFELGSAREVPESHAWTNLKDHPTVDASGADTVPVIDLMGPDPVNLVGRACEEWGVFQVRGHGIRAEFLDRVEAQIRRLFALSVEDKLKAARTSDDISGYGLVPISSFFSKLMWSEGFTISGSPLNHASKLWPHDYHQFCDVLDEYNKVMKDLAGKVLHLILQSLGLSEDDVRWAGPVTTVVQLNSYPACPDPDRAMGLAAHTDSSLLTVLFQNGVSGLQVLRAADHTGPTRWVTVPALPNAFIVNIGDLLHILSNGRLKSVVHRAVVNRKHHRVSAGYFYGPPAHVKVSPIHKLMGSSRRPAYRAVTWAEYMTLKRKLFDKALQSIKLPEEKWEEHNSVISCV